MVKTGGTTTGYCSTTKRPILCQRPKNTCFQENTQINGFNLANSPTIEDSLHSCQMKCYQTEECKYFMWNKITLKCHLKSDKDLGNMVSDPAMIIGAKHCYNCQKWKIDYEGYDLDLDEIETENPIDCQIHCQKNNECNYWSWYDPTNVCTLKSAKDESKKILNKEGNCFGEKYC